MAWCSISMWREHTELPHFSSLSSAPCWSSCGDTAATSFTPCQRCGFALWPHGQMAGSRMERGSSFILSSQNTLQVALVMADVPTCSFPMFVFLDRDMHLGALLLTFAYCPEDLRFEIENHCITVRGVFLLLHCWFVILFFLVSNFDVFTIGRGKRFQ